MKKSKIALFLLAAFLMLYFTVFAGVTSAYAETDDEMISGTNSSDVYDDSVSAVPVVNENYIYYLSKPGKARTVATSSLQMSQGGIIDYADIVKADGSKANITLKYVVNDGSGDMVDASGNAKWRMVYCLEYKKDYPIGTCTYDGGSTLSKYLVYCMTYGVQYWGETSTYASYSTGDWKKDYAVTQYAIHALNKEYVSGGTYAQNRDWILSHITYADVKAKTAQLINDALNDANYNGFSGSNYTGYKYFLSPVSQNSWSVYTNNGQAGYITDNWYNQDFRDTIYTSKSKPWYIKYVNSTVSGVSGAQVVWNNSKSWSAFKIWVPKAAYESAQVTGATITVSLTNQIPGYLSAWRYNPSNTRFQTSTIYEAGNYANQTNNVTATIARVAPKTGSISLKKTSSRPEFTNGNSMYSLKDAVYTVYKKGTSEKAGTITTDADGKGSLSGLPLGSYDVKETTAPKGYALSQQVYTVTINESNNYTVTIQATDSPQFAQISMLLRKIDEETGEATPQGNASMSGAEFTVKYYDNVNNTQDPSSWEKKPVRTWIFETNEEGIINLEHSFFKDGDALYVNDEDLPVVPLGTIVIQETCAPEGYLINNQSYVIEIKSDTNSEIISSYQTPIISEKVLRLNLKKMQSHTEKVIPGAVFEHIRPNGNAELLTTDANGTLCFKGLEWGKHVVREKSVPDGYSLNTNEILFTVKKGNVISIDSKATETDSSGKIDVSVNTEGNIEAVVEEKPAPYRLHIMKKNNQNLSIAGAEFTLYSDKECTNVICSKVTDEEGSVDFEHLYPEIYYFVKETKAPAGYRLPEKNKTYTIYAESIPVDDVFDFQVGDVKYSVKDTDTGNSVYLEGTKEERRICLNVINSIGIELPETGSSMTILLLGLGIVMGAAGMVLSNGKSKKQED